MDYKTYRKHTFEKLSQFARTFKPWMKFQNVNLSDICPCYNCDIYADYTERAVYGNIAERQYAELPDSCPCIDKIHWQMECIEKLAWYEDNDERLKQKDD